VERPRLREEIIDYWLGLRGTRRFPARSDLDLLRIAAEWPDCLLLSCGSGAGVVTLAQATRIGRREADPERGVEFTPMVTDWILSLAREVVRSGDVVRDVEDFPGQTGTVRYRVTLLPLAERETVVDHVLAQVGRA
jgi:hypothetical protein